MQLGKYRNHDIGRSVYAIILLLKGIMHTGFFPGSEAGHSFSNQCRGTEYNIYTSPYLSLALYPIKHTDMLFILGTVRILMIFFFKI